MNAFPLLHRIARGLADCRLEAVLVGNAAAALHGAPVTTVAFDFMFRKTPLNLKKLKAFASALGATILKPYYPASDLYRVVHDDLGMQCDFLARLHGVRSFAGLKSRATSVEFGGCVMLVADLADVVKSKRASVPIHRVRPIPAGGPRRMKQKPKTSRRKQDPRLEALRKESELATVDQIRRLLKLPMEKRTHFLRVRLPGGGSHL